MRDLSILILIVILFLYSLKSRKKGMYTYWWFSIFRPHDWVYMDIGALKLPMLATILFVLPTLLSKFKPKFDNLLTRLIVVFFLLEGIATFVNGCSDAPIQPPMTLFGMFLLFAAILLTSAVVDNKKTMLFLVVIIVLSLGFHSGKAGLHSLAGADYYGQTLLGGFLTGSNAMAMATGMLLFFMIFCYQSMDKKSLLSIGVSSRISGVLCKFRYVFVVIIPASYLYIIATQSRGTFLATTTALFVFVLLQRHRVKIMLILIAIALCAAPFLTVSDKFSQRIESVFAEEEDKDKSAASRPYFWGIAVDMSLDNPLGVGTGCYPAYYNKYDTTGGYYGTYRSVHSSHFQVLADVGYLGVFIWFLLFLTAYYKLWSIRQFSIKENNTIMHDRFLFNFSNAAICLITTFILGGTFYEIAYNDVIWLTFALVIVAEGMRNAEISNKNITNT